VSRSVTGGARDLLIIMYLHEKVKLSIKLWSTSRYQHRFSFCVAGVLNDTIIGTLFHRRVKTPEDVAYHNGRGAPHFSLVAVLPA
jgi:hypothetical protein